MTNTKPSQNSFKGYSYQQLIMLYFLYKMDSERKIKYLKAENVVDHNFDDLLIQTQTQKYFVQIKDIFAKDFKINDNYVSIKGKKIKKNKKLKNVLIIESIQITPDQEFFGLGCVKQDDTIIISLSRDECIEKLYTLNLEESRKNSLNLFLFSAIGKGSEISIGELPPFNFFNQQLKDKTIQIRKSICNFEKDTLVIIKGRPGIGKSHFVNELIESNKDFDFEIYRFWVSDQDINYQKRLDYKEFIRDLTYKIFKKSEIESEDNVLNRFLALNKSLIIDGLDHVKNYNKSQLDLFINFIKKAQSQKVKIIVLTRPFDFDLNSKKIIELDNWDDKQTLEYIEKKFGITDYEIKNKILSQSNGYPIITNFICADYILNNELRTLLNVKSVDDYYSSLIKEVDINFLYIFTKCKCYLKNHEIKSILGEYSYSLFETFYRKNTFLFSTIQDRISLLHDSLNLYISKTNKNFIEIDNSFNNYVLKSLNNLESRFLCRFAFLNIDKAIVLKLIKKYLNIKVFKKLTENNLDYENIKIFYGLFPSIMKDYTETDFTIIEFFDLILIQCIISRDNLEYNFDVIVPLFKYLDFQKKNDFNTEIYSSATIFNLYYMLIPQLEKQISNSNYNVNQVFNHLYDSITSFKNFIKIYKQDFLTIDDFKTCNFHTHNTYYDLELLADTICRQHIKEDEKIASDVFVQNCIYNFTQAKLEADSIIKKCKLTHTDHFSRELCNLVKNNMFVFGYFKDVNIYANNQLINLIKNKAHEGSFNVSDYISSFLKNAILFKKDIDLKSITKFHTMFYQRKDYSLSDVQHTLFFFNKKNLISKLSCLKKINKIQNMAEKGYNDNSEAFLNHFSPKKVKRLLNYKTTKRFDILPRKLNGVLINLLKKDYVVKDIFEILFKHNSYTDKKSVEFSDVKNYLESKYKEYLMRRLRIYNITINNVPANYELAIPHTKQEISKYTLGDSFKKGYINENDLEYIRDKNIEIGKLSMMRCGYYYRLPQFKIYTNFTDKELRDNILKVMFNGLCKSETMYDGSYLFHNSLNTFVEYIFYSKYKISWKKLYCRYSIFLKISNI